MCLFIGGEFGVEDDDYFAVEVEIAEVIPVLIGGVYSQAEEDDIAGGGAIPRTTGGGEIEGAAEVLG